jgi:hypothetical protein
MTRCSTQHQETSIKITASLNFLCNTPQSYFTPDLKSALSLSSDLTQIARNRPHRSMKQMSHLSGRALKQMSHLSGRALKHSWTAEPSKQMASHEGATSVAITHDIGRRSRARLYNPCSPCKITYFNTSHSPQVL